MTGIRIVLNEDLADQEQAKIVAALALVNTILQDRLALDILKKLIEENRL